MKLPRDIDGITLADHLVRRWEYVLVHQTGSHIVLRTQSPTGQTVVVPAHRPLKLGTFGGILRSVSEHKGVTKDRILEDM